MTDEVEKLKPMTFSEKWHAEKLLKKSKKKAKKALIEKGYDPTSASSMVKKALKKIVNDNRPVKKAAGRGG
jgi:SOS response regulatory protein OraA/RecX